MILQSVPGIRGASSRRVLPQWVGALSSPAAAYGAVSLALGLVLWEGIYRLFHVSPLILAPPSAVASQFVKLIGDGTVQKDISISAKEFFLGYIVAAVTAVLLGLLMGTNRRFRYVLNPWIQALYATPTISLAPVFIIWLGFGLVSKAMIVGLLVFFPVLINTSEGVRSLDAHVVEVAHAFRATPREFFWKVVFPGTLPHIFTGLRLAIARGIIGLVVGDLFGSTAGLGFLILTASQTFNTPMLFVGTVLLAIAGVALTALLSIIEHLVSPWTWVSRT